MAKYDKVTAGSPLRISAGLYNDAVDFFSPNAGNAPGSASAAGAMRVLVRVKNTTTSDRKRWDCMSLGNNRFVLGSNAEEALIYDAAAAASDKPPAILQQPIKAGEFGIACIFGYTLATIKQAGAATDLLATPYATDHNLQAGTTGTIKILSAPSTSAASIRPILIGGDGGSGSNAQSSKLVKTPGGGIAARSGTSISSASCVEFKIVSGTLTTNTDTLDVFNPWPIAIPADYYITAQQEAITGLWVAQFPGVIDVRYVLDTALEHSSDKVTYTNVETPEEC